MPVSAEQQRRWRRYWDRNSRGYDRQMGLRVWLVAAVASAALLVVIQLF